PIVHEESVAGAQRDQAPGSCSVTAAPRTSSSSLPASPAEGGASYCVGPGVLLLAAFAAFAADPLARRSDAGALRRLDEPLEQRELLGVGDERLGVALHPAHVGGGLV